MSTRLDRLFVLLENGSNVSIRLSAAKQLGEVAKSYPSELSTLLNRLHAYLRHKNWNTRISASQAVNAIAENLPDLCGAAGAGTQSTATCQSGFIRLADLDMQLVLTSGARLYSTNIDDLDEGGVTIVERSELNKNIGVDSYLNSVMESHSNAFHGMLTSDDMQLYKSDNNETTNKLSVEEVVQNTVQNKRSYSRVDNNKSQLIEEPPCKLARLKSEPVEWESTYSVLDNFCTRLLADLWQVKWEVRHGAATALRELLRHCATVVGVCHQETKSCHLLYLEDIVSRILITLALDQLSDFVSDQVVAPVRETCAQVLGIISTHLDKDLIGTVISNLKILSSSSDWMIAQGGLLGVKYILAARQDLSSSLLPLVADNLYNHLIHSADDDMRTCAAAALLPVVHCLDNIPALLEPTRILISKLWTILATLEPLSTATSSLIDLLCALNNIEVVRQSFDVSRMEEFIRTLVTFLYHSSSQVRHSSLKSLQSILNQYISESETPLNVSVLNFLMDQLFQCFILEANATVIEASLTLWEDIIPKFTSNDVAAASACRIDVWLCQAMQPSKTAFSRSILNLSPRPYVPEREVESDDCEKKYYIAGSDTVMDAESVRDSVVMETRITACKMLASLLVHGFQSESLLDNGQTFFSYVVKDILLSLHLTNKLAVPRFVTGMILTECCKYIRERNPFTLETNLSLCQQLKSQLEVCLNEVVYYEEILGSFKVMQRECRALVLCLKSLGVSMDESYTSGKLLNLEQCRTLLQLSVKLSPSKKNHNFMEAYSVAETAVDVCSRIQSGLQMRVQSSIACALIHLGWLTTKLTPIIRPIMESIRRESLPKLQSRTGEGLSRLLEHCYSPSIQINGCNAANKVIKNVATYLTEENGLYQSFGDSSVPVLALVSSQQSGDHHLNGNSKPGRAMKSEDSKDESTSLSIQRRGVTLFLECVIQHLGSRLSSSLPPLWSILHNVPLERLSSLQSNFEDAGHMDEVLTSLLCLEICLPHLSHSGEACCSELCLPIIACLTQGNALVNSSTRLRHFVSRCLASLCQFHLTYLMNSFLPRLLALITDDKSCDGQFGALETLFYMIERLGLSILPFIVLFLVPVLAQMSNSRVEIRILSNRIFANLMCLMPLEESAISPDGIDQIWIDKRKSEREFLECLMNPKKIALYSIPIPISVELRNYQQEGVNWLAFLNRYGLHGVLCDDLGLGKTLQTICILAGDHYKQEDKTTCSLVVCPSTLVGHWLYEIKRFVEPKHLKPLLYAGNPESRLDLQKSSKKFNTIIASYEIVRNDIEFFKSKHWNYIILDEGHVIRNTKAKVTKSIKSLKSSHRLVLTGTPIQNQVVELWSIFDFLMPGFLGTEQQFAQKYAKPIALSNDSKATAKEQEAGALALQSLHRQVLPFMLRRLKEDVLKDLPPKIIQDYTCELTPLQSKLYDAFTKSKMKDVIEEEEESEITTHKSPHAFQALQYLRKVCNHPCLALTADHPMYNDIKKSLPGGVKALQDLQLSGKLVALKQLLIDCGLTDENIVKNHRVLIFCQLKSMLDLVEKLVKSELPTISYLRLDGSVPATERHELVMKFNHDPSIDVLLLTTSIGGLGLNLTGADTVIFVENDWNPMKDLQAMDRAHRIGQKRVVSVYRLITAGTLEEKIMNLQAFKLAVANTVVSAENKDLASMKTDRLFDLFERDGNASSLLSSSSRTAANSRSLSKGQKNVLDLLDQMLDNNEYESEFDVSDFLKKL